MEKRSALAGVILGGLAAVLVGGRVLAAPPAADALPPGQVWECSEKGQRVFSDKPCGAHASIRQLNAINTMAPPLTASSYLPSPRMAPPWRAADAQDAESAQQEPQQEPEDYSAAPQPSVLYYAGVRNGNRALRPRRPPHHHVETRSSPGVHHSMAAGR